jgi:hypothetical protein
MYTTLATLKEIKACIPGYTRMVSFFSTHNDMKDVRIPLYVIPLLGDPDDCTWALSNGAFFDPVEYQKFYDYHLSSVIRGKFNTFLNDFGIEVSDQPTIVHEAFASYFKCTTDQQVIDWFNHYRSMRFNHSLWNELFQHQVFGDRFAFIYYVLENVSDTIDTNLKRAVLRMLWAQSDPIRFRTGVPTKRQAPRRSRYEEDEEEADDDDDDDDDEDSEQKSVARSPAERARRAAEHPVFNETTLSDEDKQARCDWLGRASDKSLTTLYQAAGLSIQIFPWYKPKSGRGLSLALALTCGEDPYQKTVSLMVDHQLPERAKVKGFMLSQANDKEPPGYHLTLNVSDPRLIFHMFHMLKAVDLNVSEMFGVNALASTVEDAVRRHGGPGNSSTLNQFTLVDEGRMELRRNEEVS